jgi:hypothetical protein
VRRHTTPAQTENHNLVRSSFSCGVDALTAVPPLFRELGFFAQHSGLTDEERAETLRSDYQVKTVLHLVTSSNLCDLALLAPDDERAYRFDGEVTDLGHDYDEPEWEDRLRRWIG